MSVSISKDVLMLLYDEKRVSDRLDYNLIVHTNTCRLFGEQRELFKLVFIPARVRAHLLCYTCLLRLVQNTSFWLPFSKNSREQFAICFFGHDAIDKTGKRAAVRQAIERNQGRAFLRF